ncbi:MAG: TetR/AcrR family transcriptional regulator [Planctomycetes bacterium]|nr:TetR/AcrR family transcriptional regulator [Planctomycetota bacterium]
MRTCDPKRGLQILAAAAQLFSKRRYHEVRMDDIAAQAKVAKGTLYRYYHDKEELYIALAIHGMERLFEESRDKLADPGDPDEKLREFITHVVRFYELHPYFLELIQRIETSNSTVSLNALNTMRSQFYHLVIDLIKQLHRSGKPLARRPEWAALALLGMIRGILRFTAQPWPSHLPKWIYHQFMNGLGAPIEDDVLEGHVPEVRFLPTAEPNEAAAS